MKRLLALFLAFAVNAYGATAIPNIFATQPSGNVPASYLDTDFALISNYNTFSNYLVDSGAANAYVVTFPAGTTGSLAAGLLINFKAGADNTGASTLAANGMTAKNITNYDATALAAGQIKAGAIVSVIYDGTQFKLAGQPGGVAPANLTPQATNTVLGNATSGTAVPTALAVGTCSTASSALIWTTNTGFGCNTSITANTAATATTATNFNNGTSSSSGGTVTATTFSGALSGNASTATTAGTVTTAAQPNITSVGTLTSVTSSGAISGTTGYFSHSLEVFGAGSDFLASGPFIGVGPTSSNFAGFWQLPASGIGMDAWVLNGSWVNVLKLRDTGIAVTGATSSTSFVDSGAHLIISSTAPTIASGFGTSPSIVANNTAAFQVTVGSGGTASAGTITMPTAPNGWACNANYTAVQSLGYIEQTNVISATQFSIANIHATTGLAVAWPAGTTIQVQCAAF